MSIVEGACKECLPSQQAQQLPAGILVRRGTQDRAWGQQLKGGKRAFPSFQLQTPGCTRRRMKKMVRWKVFGSLWNPPRFPPQRTTPDSIPQTSPLLGTRHISKPDTPTITPHKVSHWNLCGVQKNILQTKRKARSFFLFPLFLTVQPRPTPCKRFHWAEKVLLAWSANLVPSMIHNVVRSPVCL